MRKHIKKLVFAAAAGAVLPSCACLPFSETVHAASALSISGPDKVEKGHEISLSASQSGVSWRSNDEMVAKVTPDGKVKGINAGACIIIAEKGKSFAKKTVKVTLTARSLRMSRSSVTVKEGHGSLVYCTATPSGADTSGVSWHSDNTRVARVDQSGYITGVAPGTTRITASSGGIKAECNVTVTREDVVISFEQDKIVIMPGMEERINSSVISGTLNVVSRRWSSSNTSVATVSSDGTVKGHSTGYALVVETVTVRDANGDERTSKKSIDVYVSKIIKRKNGSIAPADDPKNVVLPSNKGTAPDKGGVTYITPRANKGEKPLVIDGSRTADNNGTLASGSGSKVVRDNSGKIIYYDGKGNKAVVGSNGKITYYDNKGNVISGSEAQKIGLADAVRSLNGVRANIPGISASSKPGNGTTTVISGPDGSKAVIGGDGKITYYDKNGKVISRAEAEKLGLVSAVKSRLLKTTNSTANLVFSPGAHGKMEAPVKLKDGVWSAASGSDSVIKIQKDGSYKIIGSGVTYIVYEGTDSHGNHVRYVYTIYSAVNPEIVLGTMQPGDMTFYIGQRGNIRCPEFQTISKKAKTYTLNFGQFGQFSTRNKVAKDASWSTSDSSVVKIGGDGTFIATGIGKAAVTVQDMKSAYTYNVEVKERIKETLTLDSSKSKTYTYALRQGFLKADLKPGQKAEWTSSEPRILKVDKSTGEFTTWQSGDVYITVRVGKQATKYYCHVYDRTESDSDRNDLRVADGAKTDMTAVRWSSSNSHALNIFGHGYFQAYHEGTGVLTVTNGKDAYSYKYRVIKSDKKYRKLNIATLPSDIYSMASSPIARVIAFACVAVFAFIAGWLIRQEILKGRKKKRKKQSRRRRKGAPKKGAGGKKAGKRAPSRKRAAGSGESRKRKGTRP